MFYPLQWFYFKQHPLILLPYIVAVYVVIACSGTIISAVVVVVVAIITIDVVVAVNFINIDEY